MTDKVKSKPFRGATISPFAAVVTDGEWACLSCGIVNVTENELAYERCGKCGQVHVIAADHNDLDWYEGGTAVV